MNNIDFLPRFSDSTRPYSRDILKILAIAVVYFLAHQIAFFFPDSEKVIMLVWPAGGIGLASFLLMPRRLWPILTIAFFISGVSADVFLADRSFLTGIGFMTANMAESIGCAWFILYWAKDFRDFTQVKEILALLVGAFFINALSSCIGAGTSVLTRGALFIDSWRSWYIADGLGILLCGPFIVTWIKIKNVIHDLRFQNFIEGLAFIIIWLLINLLVFRSIEINSLVRFHPYILIGLLTWASLRLGQRGVTLALLFSFAIAVFSPSIVSGPCPFDGLNVGLNSRLLELQQFLGFMAIAGYLMAAGNADHNRAEEALQKSQEKYSKAFRSSPDIIIITSLDNGLITEINDRAQDMLGYTREELIGKTTIELQIWADLFQRDQYVKSLKRNGYVHDWEVKLRAKSGGIIDTLLSGDIIELQHEKYIVATVRDISERKRAEEEKAKLEIQLQQAQKMESIGTLAGGIAHDFNNILSPIMLHSEMAMDDLAPDDPLQLTMREIYKSAIRARDLVRQILTFARKRKEEKIFLKPSLIIKEAIKFLRSTIPTTIDIMFENKAEDDTVFADPTQINQIVMNLCTNSAHAMKDQGGLISIILDNEDIGTSVSKDMLDLKPGKYLRLTVSDTGTGIPPDIIDNIFEPYFTTKGPGEGTGLGLAIIHGIVKSYGGGITVKSEIGDGTTFMVYLPIADDKPAVLEIEKPELPKGSERILIVDDEKTIIDVMKKMLSKLGYQVTGLTESIEAQEMFRHAPESFDLAIFDMTMPYITGKDLAREFKMLRPDIPIILCTGFSEQLDKKEADQIGINKFIMKPVDMKDMANTIRQLLDKEY